MTILNDSFFAGNHFQSGRLVVRNYESSCGATLELNGGGVHEFGESELQWFRDTLNRLAKKRGWDSKADVSRLNERVGDCWSCGGELTRGTMVACRCCSKLSCNPCLLDSCRECSRCDRCCECGK